MGWEVFRGKRQDLGEGCIVREKALGRRHRVWKVWEGVKRRRHVKAMLN